MAQSPTTLSRALAAASLFTLCFVSLGGCSDNSSAPPSEKGTGGHGSGGLTGTGGSAATGGAAGSGPSSGTGGALRGSGGAVGSGGKSGGTGGATSGSTAGAGGSSTATGGSSAGTGTVVKTGGNVGSGGALDAGLGGAGVTDAAAGGKGGAGGTTNGSGGSVGSGGSTGAGGGTGTKSAGCGKTGAKMDAKTQQTMQVGGTTRYYLAYVPTTYDPNTPMPMIFALHGMNMNNWWAANDSSGFKLIEATSNKAIIVYPQGSGDAPGTKSQWGGINSNWSPGTTGADDKFIDALLASMEDSYCVDTSRVFVTGFSMGGWMTSNFACDHAKVFRAFAPVAGWGPGDMSTGHGSKPKCDDTSVTVPIIITQGTTDGTVTPENGANSRDFWTTRDGCSAITAANSTGSTANCVAAAGCKSGAVSWCTHGGGHMVPSNAGTYIWSFFSQF